MEHQQAVESAAAERYLLEEMSELERYQFEEHYFECAECAESVREGAAMAAGARASAERRAAAPAVVQRVAQTRAWSVRTFLPLAAAAVLAVVAGYQALVTIPGLRADVGPRVLRPIALAPASRGDAVTIPASEASQGLTLLLDVIDGAATNQLTYQLASAGAVVVSGSADRPKSGTPLVLWLPARVLTPGDYVLTLRAAAIDDRELARYPFLVR